MEREAPEPADQFVEAGGLHLWTSVRGQGLPLLLVNGIGATVELLDPIRDALEGVRTIAFDAPGAGRSPAPCLPLRLPSLARVLAEMLDRLGYAQVDVMGASWGSALAQELAWRYPARVRRLILAAATPGWIGLPPSLTGFALLATPWRYRFPSLRERVAPSLYGGELRDDPGMLRREGLLRTIRPPTFRGYLTQGAAMLGWTSLPWLWRVTQPTLILAGDDDPITPLFNSRMMARFIPDSRLYVIKGGGHLSLLTRAREVAPVILEFLGH